MIDKYPGFLGYNSELILIHADWPIYPRGIGWEIALKSIGKFPIDSTFYEIDDIDRCKLLISQNPNELNNPFDSNHYHLAIWHKDLIKLQEMGFINGVLYKSNYELELIRYENIKKKLGSHLELDRNGNIILSIKDKNSKLQKSTYLKPQNEGHEDNYILRDCAVIPQRIGLTEAGIQKLHKIAMETNTTEVLRVLTQPLLDIKRFDTAIRDASLLVETKIKVFHKNPELHGQKLIQFHIKEIITKNNISNTALIKGYKGE